MEFIGIILILYFMGWVAGLVGKGAAYVSDEVFNTDFSQNLKFKISELSQEEKADELSDTVMYGVYIKGNPKITSYEDIAICIKLYDVSGEWEVPLVVQSTFETTSEVNGRGFEHVVSLGSEMVGKYWPDWVRISALIPESLIGPYKGRRNLMLKCTFWPVNSIPIYEAGVLPEKLKQYEKSFGDIGKHTFEFDLINSGYLELDNERLEVQKASVRMAVLIALADGSLDKKEGNQIKKWIKGIIDSTSEKQKNNIKKILNNELEDSFKDAKKNNIDVKVVCNNIKNIGSRVDKYDLIELCLDVMAADGEADKEELKEIEKISKLIGIDYNEITKMKDQRLIKLDPSSASAEGLEEKLGIDANWDKAKIKKHIIALYGKWNGRLNSLPEGVQRENAQKMLDLIAEARKKYS